MQKLDVFLTGGTGFIGRWTLKELTSMKKHVGVLARNPEKAEIELKQWIKQHGGNPEYIRLIQGDMSKPGLGLSEKDKNAVFEVQDIYNIAGSMGWSQNYDESHKVNVEGALVLAEMASQCKNLRRFVHVSGFMNGDGRDSESVRGYEVQRKWTSEEWYKHSKKAGVYESTKGKAHFAIQDACRQFEIPLTILNPGGLIGDSVTGEIPITQSDGILSIIDQLFTGKLTAIPGRPEDWLPLISVDFFSALMARIPEHEETSGQVYWILDDRTPDFKSIINMVAGNLKVKAPRFHIPVKVLSFLLRAGLSKLTGLSHEGLQFVVSKRFNIEDEKKLANTLCLDFPDIENAIKRTIVYYMNMKYGINTDKN